MKIVNKLAENNVVEKRIYKLMLCQIEKNTDSAILGPQAIGDITFFLSLRVGLNVEIQYSLKLKMAESGCKFFSINFFVSV